MTHAIFEESAYNVKSTVNFRLKFVLATRASDAFKHNMTRSQKLEVYPKVSRIILAADGLDLI